MGTLQCQFDEIVFPTSRVNAMNEVTDHPDCDALIIGTEEPFSAEILSQLPRLKVIGTIATGTDNINMEALARRRIKLVTAYGINAPFVAEHALGMMLALAKALPGGQEACRTGRERDGLSIKPISLLNSTIGIIGAGNIAKELATRLRSFGPKQFHFWTKHPEAHAEITQFGTFEPLETLMQRSQFVSLNIALTPETKELITYDLIKSMPENAVLINTSRAGIVSMTGLERAMQERPDIRFGIDATGMREFNFLYTESNKDRVLTSPHAAAVPAISEMRRYVANNVIKEVRSLGLCPETIKPEIIKIGPTGAAL